SACLSRSSASSSSSSSRGSASGGVRDEPARSRLELRDLDHVLADRALPARDDAVHGAPQSRGVDHRLRVPQAHRPPQLHRCLEGRPLLELHALERHRLDGASSWSILWRILLPFGKPAVLTLVVLLFMSTWNEFLLALVLISNENRRTAPLGLAWFQDQYTIDPTGLAAGAAIIALPIVLVYVFLQRDFIRGMLSGALKG